MEGRVTIKENGLKGTIIKEVARNSKNKLYEIKMDNGSIYYKSERDFLIKE